MVIDAGTLFFGIIVPFLEILAFVTAVHAITTVRSSQASIAWAVSLVTFPFLALPLYWVFGRRKFNGYVEAIRQGHEEHAQRVDQVICSLKQEHVSDRDEVPDEIKAFENLNRGFPFLGDNDVELLIDGEATFSRMFEDIDQAREYILLQYFIVHDDGLGSQLKAKLVAKATQGVRVYFLFDEIGCHKLPKRYIDELSAAGVYVSPFATTQGRGNRFQLNFRNHRKITVVDGSVAYLGGHNVGDAYLGLSPKFGHWRDTHLRIKGPSVCHVQMTFFTDWYFATRCMVPMKWEGDPGKTNGTNLLILASGPADSLDTCSLMFVLAIQLARKRIWISSPYFIPNEAVIQALQIAATRGVDVRIMLPIKPDHKIVYLAGFSFMAQLCFPNIRFYRYEPGFLHQKAFVVDSRLAMVGTANVDNRSFRLNFEISALSTTPAFVQEVGQMLETDFSKCRQVNANEAMTRGMVFDFIVKLARLFSPIL